MPLGAGAGGELAGPTPELHAVPVDSVTGLGGCLLAATSCPLFMAP